MDITKRSYLYNNTFRICYAKLKTSTYLRLLLNWNLVSYIKCCRGIAILLRWTARIEFDVELIVPCMIERMESKTWACSLRETATPVPRQATQHHTLYFILYSREFDWRSIHTTEYIHSTAPPEPHGYKQRNI